MKALSLRFSGVEVQAARYLPAEFGHKPMANMQLRLTGDDVKLKPDQASADSFLLVRRADGNPPFHVNSTTLGTTEDRIQAVGRASVQPLLEALEGDSVSFAPDVDRNTFQRALERMKED